MDLTRPRRSALFMPASNPRAIEKARGLACDVVVLDLEDAVAPGDKSGARAAAVAAIAAGGWGGRELVVRVNAPGTEWGMDDLDAFAGAGAALLIPKADRATMLTVVERAPATRFWAMVETARGVVELPALAATPRLAGLVVGTNDLARELRCVPGADRLPLLPALMATVTAARAHGLVALDGVFNAIDDAAGLAAECAQGVRLGFDGKSLIHPAQIEAANAAFSPSAEAIAAAARLVAGWAAAGGDAAGVVKVDGRMVERLHVDQAEALLARARAIGA